MTDDKSAFKKSRHSKTKQEISNFIDDFIEQARKEGRIKTIILNHRKVKVIVPSKEIKI